MAKKYYTRLFREYALVDLSCYKDKKLGLRWRRESEVVSGKGQFLCGNITPTKKCDATTHLHSFEINFAYIEEGTRKNELVKVRLCPRCAKKMNKGRSDVEKKQRKEGDSGRKRGRVEISKEIPPCAVDRDRGAHQVSSSSDSTRAAPFADASATDAPKDDGVAKDSSKDSSLWRGEPPKGHTEEDEMDQFLAGLFM
jgi:protein FRA10AC1